MTQRYLFWDFATSGTPPSACTVSPAAKDPRGRTAWFLVASLGMLPLLAFAAVPPAPPAKICVESAPNCGTDPTPAGTRIKWHPGHYMLVYRDAPQSQLDDIRDEPTVKGAQIRYMWADLEPRKGVYDFSRIESDLDYLASMPTPKRLIAQIMDREFNTDDPTGAVPDYLLNDSQYNGGVARSKNGYIARIWDQAVMDRQIALYQALAHRFNDEPYFEGITTEETAPGFDSESPPDYSRPALAAQLKRMMVAARRAWPNTNVFVYTNFLVGELEGIISHAHTNQCGVGGPDVTPRAPSAGARIIMGIDGGVRFAGKMPIAFAVQSPELCGKEGCNRPPDIYSHAVNELGVNYLFWLRFGTAKDTATDKYSWRDGMLPVIRANNGRINAACPSNYHGACSTD